MNSASTADRAQLSEASMYRFLYRLGMDAFSGKVKGDDFRIGGGVEHSAVPDKLPFQVGRVYQVPVVG